jgi:hypothetical protein
VTDFALWHDGAKWRFEVWTPAGLKGGWRPTRRWAKHAALRQSHHPVVPCSACGKHIDPHARRCMHCGAWVEREPMSSSGDADPRLEPAAPPPPEPEPDTDTEPEPEPEVNVEDDDGSSDGHPDGPDDVLGAPAEAPRDISGAYRILATILLASIIVTATLLFVALTR